jgi:hypothetical protein
VSAGSFAARGFAEEVRCPETIAVKQNLAKPEPGWKESLSDMPNRLAGVTFFDGPPEEKASLVYDAESLVKGKRITRWHFGPQSQIWLSCRYVDSSVVLSRALMKGTSECQVTYDPSVTTAGLPLVEKTECK